jgi:PAS domain S-box-containing protein
MRRPPQTPLSPAHDYTPDVGPLRDRLTALTRRWGGVAPAPPSLSEAVEELTATVEELQAMKADLTQSQQAVMTSRQRYQALFEGVPEAYRVTDAHGLIQAANRLAAHLCNIGRSQLAGLPLGGFMAQDLRRAFRAQLARSRTGAAGREWIIRVQPRHGPAVTVACRVAPALDTEGRLVGLRWLLRDATAQPHTRQTLEQRVRELTRQLAHAQSALQAMQNRTERRVRGLRHRMKNDLQVVSSLLDWQGQGLEGPRARTIFEACQGRIRALSVIHELLYRAGDLGRIELGLVTIMLRAAPAGQVTLTVRDTGVGWPPDREAREGESYGLHLVRALAGQLRGTMTFTHERGTCVTLTFPL